MAVRHLIHYAIPHLTDVVGGAAGEADRSNADVRFCIAGTMGRGSDSELTVALI